MRPYVIEAPAMFVFHHANAFQVPAGSGSSSSKSSSIVSSSSSEKELLVLDTVGWADINFENSQHNLNTSYYKGEQVVAWGCMEFCGYTGVTLVLLEVTWPYI
jgi:carotenoid cleavage dioxygenase-like enzyme